MEKCPPGSHFGEWKKSSKTARGRFLWVVWILCAPKMTVSVSQQTLVVSSVSSTHRRRPPKSWMNQRRVSGYLVKNTLQDSLTSWDFQCGFWEECSIGLLVGIFPSYHPLCNLIYNYSNCHRKYSQSEYMKANVNLKVFLPRFPFCTQFPYLALVQCVCNS